MTLGTAVSVVRGVTAAALLSISVAGCSSGDDTASPSTEAAGVTTSAPTSGPLTTTTSIAGTPVSDIEIYTLAGLSSEQGECIARSGADGEFEASTPPQVSDALVLTAENGSMIAVPATLRTGAELEQLILSTLAAPCAPADLLAKLASIDGQASDEAALTDDLPVRLFGRRRDGATPAELACLEAKFREAPARLTSLAAHPRLIEAQCAPAERLAAWRVAALDRGLGTAGATDGERACLSASSATADQSLLAATIEAVGSGDVSVDPLGGATPECVSADRLTQLALDVVALGDDFGVEPVAPS